jgi:hypothetical protein
MTTSEMALSVTVQINNANQLIFANAIPIELAIAVL